MYQEIKIKCITLTNLRIKWTQPTTHLEATSIQGKFPMAAPNKADWEDFNLYSPLNTMYHTAHWALKVAVYQQRSKSKQKNH